LNFGGLVHDVIVREDVALLSTITPEPRLRSAVGPCCGKSKNRLKKILERLQVRPLLVRSLLIVIRPHLIAIALRWPAPRLPCSITCVVEILTTAGCTLLTIEANALDN